MKTLLAALSFFSAATLFAGPAAAYDDGYFVGPPILLEARDHGGWRDREDWRAGRDGDGWRGRDERWGHHREILSEGQIARRVVRQGFVRIEDIDRRRDRYIVRAVRPNGALIRLAVDAYDGDILARERIGWVASRHYGYDRDYRRPTSGVEFDLGNGRVGIYGR